MVHLAVSVKVYCHYNGPVYFPIIFMSHLIIRILCMYYGKDIGLNTVSLLQSWVSHMTMWGLSLPLGKMM